jgi:hypothetical protein
VPFTLQTFSFALNEKSVTHRAVTRSA